MKIRLLIGAILFTLFTAVTFFQIAGVNSSVFAANPITGPVPSPTPGPITNPVTAFTRVKGAITYRFLKLPANTISPYIMPARNVIVKAVNNITNETKVDKTGSRGHYALELAPGEYTITVSDVKGTRFSPRNKVLTLLQNSETENLNFHGDIAYFLFLNDFKLARGSQAGDPNYNPIYDINNNEAIKGTDRELLDPILIK